MNRRIGPARVFWHVTEAAAVAIAFDVDGNPVEGSRRETPYPARIRTDEGKRNFAGACALELAKALGLEPWRVFEDELESELAAL